MGQLASTQQGIAVANPKKEIVVDKRKPDSTKSAVAKSENVVNEPRKEEIKKEMNRQKQSQKKS